MGGGDGGVKEGAANGRSTANVSNRKMNISIHWGGEGGNKYLFLAKLFPLWPRYLGQGTQCLETNKKIKKTKKKGCLSKINISIGMLLKSNEKVTETIKNTRFFNTNLKKHCVFNSFGYFFITFEQNS